MGKSIRSKRKKRLRSIKRELVEPHYDAKDAIKLAIQDAALAGPKIELPKKREDIGSSHPSRGRSTVSAVSSSPAAMAVDADSPSASTPSLKAKGGIRKRGKSTKGHLTKKNLKSKKKKGLKF